MIIIYFTILLFIGYYGYKQATGNLSEFMLGGRSMVLMCDSTFSRCIRYEWLDDYGLPGSVYSTGLSAMWITTGLSLGAYVNYFVVAPRLRVIYRIGW